MAVTVADLAALAEELCDPRQHVERVWDRDAHRNKRLRCAYVTTQPGLLAQLAEAVTEASSSPEDGGGHSVPGSRPPGAWEAMARHSAITVAAARWCWSLKVEQRESVEGNIRALVGAAAQLDSDALAALVAEARGWRHAAAVMTGWASPSFTPQVACPVVDCGRVNTIRVNLDRRLALCSACESRWSDEDEDGSFAVLARYVEAATERRDRERVKVRSGRVGNGGWIGPAA